jgi:hypothetical protein
MSANPTTQKTNFTPGPWKLSFTDDTVVVDSTGRDVATVAGDYNSADECPVMEANAHLIAAAPELYGAGIALNALIDRMQENVVAFLTDRMDAQALINALIYLQDGPEQRAAQGAMTSALAKARGEA